MNSTMRKYKRILATLLLGFFALTVIFIAGSGYKAAAQNNQAERPKVSADEVKAVKKIQEAKNLDETIKATEEFIKKYPKSIVRNQAARYLAEQILKTDDDSQIVAKSEAFFRIFSEPGEAELIIPGLIYSYTSLKRYKDAFDAAEKYLSRYPEDVAMRTQMAIEGSNLMRTGNREFLAQTRAYGTKAIELIETGKRPENIDETKWQEYQTRWLPQLYQSMGIVDYLAGNKKDAQTRLEKAVALNRKDVNSWAILGSMLNDEYQDMARKYTVMNAGAERDQLLKQVNEKLDKIIETYARILALTDGDPNARALNTQVRQDLETYYKYRHKSTDGMQQLIDKYKVQ